MKALFVGRFQPFHQGHLHAIQAAKEHYGDVVVVVGSSQFEGTDDNPITVEQRVASIRQALPDVNIVTQPDVFNDKEWARQVARKVDFDVAVTGNDWVRDCFRSAGKTVEEPEWYHPEKYNGTTIRKRMLDGRRH